MNSSSRLIVVFVVAFAFVFTSALRPSYACGPFSRYAIFSYSKHPDIPFERYSGGDIGVLQTTYARSYLYVAYRLMNGGSFNSKEQAALSRLWNDRLDYSNGNEGDSTSVWIATRKKVTGMGPDPQLEVNRVKSKDDYEYFVNCNGDAFKTAARALQARIDKVGADTPSVKSWTLAQDQVFSNCGGGQTIPEPTSSSDVLERADRDYQIAAAHFYSMNFDEARSHFERIAKDNNSPWHEQADYLVARSLIRKASLGDAAGRVDGLTQAEAVLNRVVSETKSAALRQSAQGLLDLVELRLHPETRLRKLAQSLVSKDPNDSLNQDVLDYTLLLDRYIGDSDQPLDETLKKAVDGGEKDDLTDWLLAFQSADESSLSHSLEKWEKTQSHPWLISCLSKVDANNPRTSSLMAAAALINPERPAFLSAQFHVIRLLIEKGDRTGAIKRLDGILQNEAKLPSSAVNQFRRQRMTLATNLNDFLRFALRRPAAFSWDDDGRETPIDLKTDDELKLWIGRDLLDVDSTNILNERFPLGLLREAAASDVLPEHVRRQIALVVWTRAVILDDTETGKAIAPLAAKLAPELRTSLSAYLSAATKQNRQSVAIYTLLKFPGLKPYLDSSTGRLTPIAERDIYRDNWWCEVSLATGTDSDSSDVSEDGSETPGKTIPPATPVTLDFVTSDQAALAKRERSQLISLGAAPNYLAREAIEWAKRDPNDPRVAEALHIAVTSTRYGCTDKESPKWSKAAFDLLHKRFPQSIWAKKTPYWFKDI